MSERRMFDGLPMEVLAAELLMRLPGWNDVPEHHRRDTPRRFVHMLEEMCTPTDYDERFTVFTNDDGIDEMVTLGPIPFYTLCAHHLAPFYGVAHIGYIPNKMVAGLSKFDRVVKGIAKGLWIQELLTQEIASYLDTKLEPLGVAVVLRAEHLCMAMRGTKQPGVLTTTSCMKGYFGDHNRTAKAEFLRWIESQ